MSGRRANGEGSVFQRKDGRWTAVTPHPERKHFTRKTQSAALLARSTFLKSKRGHVSNASSKQTLAEYLESWLASVEPSLSYSTFHGYSILVHKHIVPIIGSTLLRSIGPQHIHEVTVTLSPQPAVAKAAWKLLRQAFAVAVKWEFVSSNPVSKTTPPKLVKPSIETLTAGEIRSFLALGDALGSFLLLTGARMGEALALEWKHIDIDKSRVTFAQTLQQGKAGLVVKEQKTASSKRTNRAAKKVMAILRAHRKAQLEMRLKAGAKWQPWPRHDFVFTTDEGKPIGRGNAGRHVKALFRAIGIDRRPHDLRHTFATELLRRGAPVRTVQLLLGHASPMMTHSTYSHTVPGMLDDAAAMIDVMAEG
jgi:integrase